MDFNYKKFCRQTLHAVLNLFYPPLCAHCQSVLQQRGPLFCALCLEVLSLIEVKGRCRCCFCELKEGRCDRCMRRKVVVHRQLAACEAMGPALSLLQGMNQGRRECIPAAASLMAYQWLEQKMLLPEILIPLPSSFLQKQKLGFDPRLLLAQELGKIFATPVMPLLKRKFDSAHLFAQGEFQSLIYPIEKKAEILCDKRILIVAPKLDDATARHVGIQLQPYFPAQIEMLALAVSVE